MSGMTAVLALMPADSSATYAAKLERDLLEAKSISNSVELADFFKTTILDDMAALRVSVDSMEPMASTDRWPVPSYGKLLFDVR